MTQLHFLQDIPAFISKIETLIPFNVNHLFLDHVCYRVETSHEYSNIKLALLKQSILLTEEIIQGRKISVFKLHSPIIYNNRSVDVIELPDVKPGSFYKTGWEHAEYVVDDLDAFRLTFDGFEYGGFYKHINRDLRIQFQDVSVKFHEQSLENVVEMERGK